MAKILSDAYNADVPSSFVMAHAIKDTIHHFGAAPAERRLKHNVYDNGRSGKECAIGRFADTELMRRNGVGPGKGADFFSSDEGRPYLPESFRGLPPRFFYGLISLHDCDSYWTSNGLSSRGKTYVRLLISDLHIQGAANVVGLSELVD